MKSRFLKTLMLSAAFVGFVGSAALSATMNYLGSWSNVTSYKAGSVVVYNDAIYYSLKSTAKAPNRNYVPSSSPTWWTMVGTVGNTIHNGPVNPTSPNLGQIGDFYLNTQTNELFGPKTAISPYWPADGTLLSGSAGAAGPQGEQGPQGLQGATGAAGPQGPTGLAGVDGATGPQGTAGVAGATGPAGVAGATGLAGATGAAGPQGTAGVAGATGSAGVAGATGPTGPVGPSLEIVNSFNEVVSATIGPSGSAIVFLSAKLNSIGDNTGTTCSVGVKITQGVTTYFTSSNQTEYLSLSGHSDYDGFPSSADFFEIGGLSPGTYVFTTVYAHSNFAQNSVPCFWSYVKIMVVPK